MSLLNLKAVLERFSAQSIQYKWTKKPSPANWYLNNEDGYINIDGCLYQSDGSKYVLKLGTPTFTNQQEYLLAKTTTSFGGTVLKPTLIIINKINFYDDGLFLTTNNVPNNRFINAINLPDSYAFLKMNAAVTSIVYIDQTRLVNGTGTYTNPFNTMPADFSYSGNTAYMIKSGSILSGSRIMNSVNNCYFGSYGDTAIKPIWLSGSDAHCLNFAAATNCTAHGINFQSNGTSCVRNNSLASNATLAGHSVLNCTFTMTVNQTYVTNNGGAGTDCDAVWLTGAGNKIIGNTIHDIPTDGIWCSGNAAEVAYNVVYNVAKDGRFAGDCIQFANGDNYWIHHNYVDHRGTYGKQCIMGGNSGLNGVLEDNYCVHNSTDYGGFATNTIYLGTNGVICRRNIIIGGQYSILTASTAYTIESNYIENSNVRTDVLKGTAVGFSTGGSITGVIQNNTIVGLDGAKSGMQASSYSGSVTSLTIKNNIVKGFSTAITYSNAANVVCTNNVLFDNTGNFDGIISTIAANTYNVDPKLDSNYIPQEPLIYVLGAAGAITDLYGKTFNVDVGQMAVGCVQADMIFRNEASACRFASKNSMM